MFRCFRFIVTASLTFACSGSLAEPRAGARVAITRLSSGPYSLTYDSAIGEAERIVIRDNATWQSMWTSMWRNVSPTPALPDVDFTKEMLIVAALGSRPTGSYSIVVDSARMTSSGLMVWVGTSSPGPRCFTTQAFTAPVDVARIQRIDAAVGFVDVPSVVQC